MGDAAIRTEGLGKRFGSFDALRPLSLEVVPGLRTRSCLDAPA
jgi:hypothetical protein